MLLSLCHLSVASGKLTEKHPVLLSLLLIVSLCDSIYLYKPSHCFFLGEPFAFRELHYSTHGPVQIVPFHHVFAHITFFLSWILVSLFSAHLNGLFSDSSQFLKTSLSLFCIISVFILLTYKILFVSGVQGLWIISLTQLLKTSIGRPSLSSRNTNHLPLYLSINFFFLVSSSCS